MTGDIRELVQGQPSLTAPAPLHTDPGADAGQRTLETCQLAASACARERQLCFFSFFFFFLVWSRRGAAEEAVAATHVVPSGEVDAVVVLGQQVT